MNHTISYSDICEMKDMLDKSKIKEDGRFLHYIDLNGESAFLESGRTVIDQECLDLMPSHIAGLFLGVNK